MHDSELPIAAKLHRTESLAAVPHIHQYYLRLNIDCGSQLVDSSTVRTVATQSLAGVHVPD